MLKFGTKMFDDDSNPKNSGGSKKPSGNGFSKIPVFTLLAWAFAYSYVVCQAIEPGSFTAAIDPHGQRTWMELLFLSFTTLSSTGLSDVVPVQAFARSLCMIEQLAGVAYVAMVVSRLVGLTVTRR